MLGEVTPGHERTLYGTSEVNGMGGTCTPSRTNKVDCQAVCIGEGADAPCGRNGLMPRQRINHSRRTKAFPEGFSERLKRFHEESGLSMSENARRLRDLTGPPYGVGLKAGCGPT